MYLGTGTGQCLKDPVHHENALLVIVGVELLGLPDLELVEVPAHDCALVLAAEALL